MYSVELMYASQWEFKEDFVQFERYWKSFKNIAFEHSMAIFHPLKLPLGLSRFARSSLSFYLVSSMNISGSIVHVSLRSSMVAKIDRWRL